MNRLSRQNRQKSPNLATKLLPKLLLPNCYQEVSGQRADRGGSAFSARLKYQLLARRERLYGSVHLTAWVCRKMYCIYRAIVYRRPQIARPSHQENRHVLVIEQDCPVSGTELAMGLRPTHWDENWVESVRVRSIQRGRQRSFALWMK